MTILDQFAKHEQLMDVRKYLDRIYLMQKVQQAIIHGTYKSKITCVGVYNTDETGNFMVRIGMNKSVRHSTEWMRMYFDNMMAAMLHTFFDHLTYTPTFKSGNEVHPTFYCDIVFKEKLSLLDATVTDAAIVFVNQEYLMPSVVHDKRSDRHKSVAAIGKYIGGLTEIEKLI